MRFLVLICVLGLVSCVVAVSTEEMAAQWAVEIHPSANAKEVASRLGFDYEGPHRSIPNIHLMRLQEQHRTPEIHAEKIEALKTTKEIIWAEVQLPRERSRRE